MEFKDYETLSFGYEGRVLTVTIDGPGLSRSVVVTRTLSVIASSSGMASMRSCDESIIFRPIYFRSSSGGMIFTSNTDRHYLPLYIDPFNTGIKYWNN